MKPFKKLKIVTWTNAGSVLSTQTNTIMGIEERAFDPEMMKRVNKTKLKGKFQFKWRAKNGFKGNKAQTKDK